mgnify:CR=1 FL=1
MPTPIYYKQQKNKSIVVPAGKNQCKTYDIVSKTITISSPPGSGKTYWLAHQAITTATAGYNVFIGCDTHKNLNDMVIHINSLLDASTGVKMLVLTARHNDELTAEDVYEDTKNNPHIIITTHEYLFGLNRYDTKTYLRNTGKYNLLDISYWEEAKHKIQKLLCLLTAEDARKYVVYVDESSVLFYKTIKNTYDDIFGCLYSINYNSGNPILKQSAFHSNKSLWKTDCGSTSTQYNSDFTRLYPEWEIHNINKQTYNRAIPLLKITEGNYTAITLDASHGDNTGCKIYSLRDNLLPYHEAEIVISDMMNDNDDVVSYYTQDKQDEITTSRPSTKVLYQGFYTRFLKHIIHHAEYTAFFTGEITNEMRYFLPNSQTIQTQIATSSTNNLLPVKIYKKYGNLIVNHKSLMEWVDIQGNVGKRTLLIAPLKRKAMKLYEDMKDANKTAEKKTHICFVGKHNDDNNEEDDAKHTPALYTERETDYPVLAITYLGSNFTRGTNDFVEYDNIILNLTDSRPVLATTILPNMTGDDIRQAFLDDTINTLVQATSRLLRANSSVKQKKLYFGITDKKIYEEVKMRLLASGIINIIDEEEINENSRTLPTDFVAKSVNKADIIMNEIISKMPAAKMKYQLWSDYRRTIKRKISHYKLNEETIKETWEKLI